MPEFEHRPGVTWHNTFVRRRLAVPRDMAETESAPEFLTTREVANLLRVRERKVYDMAAAGEIPCKRVTGKLLFPRRAIEAWLADPTADAEPSANSKPVPRVIAGSHDPLLDWALREAGTGLATVYDGSITGLDRFAAGEAAACGLHIIEPDQGDWNIGHVRQTAERGPQQGQCVLLEWARRRQGFLTRSDDKLIVENAADLPGKRVALRQEAAGSRLLLDHLLDQAGLSHGDLDLAPAIARTETDAATLVASGQADVALGLETAARQFGLGFVPVSEERFDLLITHRAYFEPAFQALFAFTRTDVFDEKAAEMGGYDISHHGRVVWNSA